MKKTALIRLIANCSLLIASLVLFPHTVKADCSSATISPPSGASFTLFTITATGCNPDKGYRFNVRKASDPDRTSVNDGELGQDPSNRSTFSGTFSGIPQTGMFVADVVETSEQNLVASLEFSITEVRPPRCGERVAPNSNDCPTECLAVRNFEEEGPVWRCTISQISQPPRGPIPPPYVPCNQTRDPEFHSLRPYQASPCNPNLEEQNLTNYCANDFITQDKITVDYSSGSSCASGGQSCRRFSIQRNLNIGINFNEASLPILGNTELVRNSQNAGLSPDDPSFLTAAQKMSNYVSWFLNGSINRAEEGELKSTIQEDIDKAINFSGPTSKLLPRGFLDFYRIKTIIDAILQLRHNQIIACKDVGILSREEKISPCYGNEYPDSFREHLRLRDLGIYDILFLNPDDLNDLFTDLFRQAQERAWSLVVFRNEITAKIFKYVPLASTEDLLGESRIDTNTTPQQAGSEVNIVNPSVNATGNSLLYFPHIEETAGLATTLQSTFASKDSLSQNPGPENRQVPQRCENIEVRANPGDDLFAENNIRPAGFAPQVPNETTGTVSYTAEFECVFSDYHPIRNPDPSCAKTASVAVPILVRMPRADTLKQRLVDGPAGIAARFYPKTGPGTGFMEEGFKDIPGVSNASYFQTNGETPLAGDPSRQRQGSSAQVFFPGLGSIYDYFLNGIQRLLRPKDLTPSAPVQETPQQQDKDQGDISSNLVNYCLQTRVERPQAQTIAEVVRKSIAEGIEGQVFSDYIENFFGGGDTLFDRPCYGTTLCYNYVMNRSIRAGWNPAFVLALWIEESAASNHERFPRVEDLGCGKIQENLSANLDCLFDNFGEYDQPGEFDDFLSRYSGNFITPTFPRKLLDWYEKLIGRSYNSSETELGFCKLP